MLHQHLGTVLDLEKGMLACDDAVLWELSNDGILEVISYSLSSLTWDCNFHVFLGMFFLYNIYKKMSAAGIICKCGHVFFYSQRINAI